MPIIEQDWGPAFYAELEAICRTQWPNLGAQNYFLVMQSSWENVVQQIRQAQVGQGIPPPYVVVDVGQFDETEEWGLQNRLKRAKLRISYVIKMTDKASTNQTNQEAVQSDIYLLSETLDASDSTGSGMVSPQTFRPIENCQIDSSLEQPYNSAFRESDDTLWCCSLNYSEGVIVGNLDPYDQNTAKTANGKLTQIPALVP